MTPEIVKARLIGFQNKRIMVIGDMMLDEFVWGKAQRISPEAPVPVIDIQDESYSLGGAGNVIANIRALGGIPIPISVMGRDIWADKVIAMLVKDGIWTKGIIREEGIQTTVKTRLIASSTQANQQIVRADRGNAEPLDKNIVTRLIDLIHDEIKTVDAVIVSDYDKGVASGLVLTMLLELAKNSRRFGVPVFIDPKLDEPTKYRGATLVKPNIREAEILSGIVIRNESTMIQAGHMIQHKLEAEFVLLTRGEAGMTLFRAEGDPIHIAAHAQEVYDATGAGDTVISTLALAYCAGSDMSEAAEIANTAAGIVVGKLGTATVDPHELLMAIDGRFGAKDPRVVVFAELNDERIAQDLQWGGPGHDDEHDSGEWISYIEKQLDACEGEIDDARKQNNDEQPDVRKRMVKIAAIAIAAIESIDRN